MTSRSETGVPALAHLPLLSLDEGNCLGDQALDICHKAGERPEFACSLMTPQDHADDGGKNRR
jgi:LysR family hydrogen peroxide-inducible transcriptional activator